MNDQLDIKIESMDIKSYPSGYRCWVQQKANDITEQHFILHRDGRIYLSANYLDQDKEKIYRRHLTINPSLAKEILDTLGMYYRVDDDQKRACAFTDALPWEMEIKYSNGLINHYMNYGDNIEIQGKSLSAFIRDKLNMPELCLFDNDYGDEPLTRVKIDYYKDMSDDMAIKTDQKKPDLPAVYHESLVINRKQERISYIEENNDYKISHKYQIGKDLDDLMEKLGAFDFSMRNKDKSGNSNNESLKIVLNFIRRPVVTFEYNQESDTLPSNWDNFITLINDYLAKYDSHLMFETHLGSKQKRRIGQYIYLSVVFSEGYGKSYYYLTDDESIEIGDEVDVPETYVGSSTIATVVNVEYFYEDEVPFPIDKTKHIIGKYR